MNHYLLTISVPGNHQHMHGYLMCNGSQNIIEGAISRMMDWMEGRGIRFLPVVLATTLTTGVNTVRKIARKQDKSVGPLLSQATNFHFTVWMMPDDHPDDRRLMKLH
jgi:hypothetical protein